MNKSVSESSVEAYLRGDGARKNVYVCPCMEQLMIENILLGHTSVDGNGKGSTEDDYNPIDDEIDGGDFEIEV